MFIKIYIFVLFLSIINSINGAAIPENDTPLAVLVDYETQTTDTDRKFA